MKEFYIIRHGETDYNKRGVVQGRGIDSDLNEWGKVQAESFYRAYRHVEFDKIYTSTLKRTHQTVKRFIEKGIEWEQLEGLDELDWGVNEGKQINLQTRSDFHVITRKWMEGELHLKFDNGESPLEVNKRQVKALDHILSRDGEDIILICMHGRALRLLLCYLLDFDLSQMDTFPHSNVSLYRLLYNGEKFELMDFNNTDHFNA